MTYKELFNYANNSKYNLNRYKSEKCGLCDSAAVALYVHFKLSFIGSRCLRCYKDDSYRFDRVLEAQEYFTLRIHGVI